MTLRMPAVASAAAGSLGRRRSLRGNENVGGGGHDCDMSELHITGTDTNLTFGPWFLTEAPLVDVDSQANLR